MTELGLSKSNILNTVNNFDSSQIAIEHDFHLQRTIRWTMKQEVHFFCLTRRFFSQTAHSSCWKVEVDRTHSQASAMAELDLVYDVTVQINSRELSVGEMTVNIRSLTPKYEQLQVVLEKYRNLSLVLGLSETWLDQSVLYADVAIPGFKMFRKDRDRRGGGGVL